MVNIGKIKQRALDSKRKFGDFFKQEEHNFRASFHLRPTSSGVTIVSTLPVAPMRGINIQNDKLGEKLLEIRRILNETDNNKILELLRGAGFNMRTSESNREENVQAALIRDMVLHPANYEDMFFVASEFDLFGYGENGKETKRADVLAYKDSFLYNIELKNQRLTETAKQVNGYVKHIKDNLDAYSDCLAEFPNCNIQGITDVKGIALVPYSERSGGGLEETSELLGIELWFFTEDYKIIKHTRQRTVT